MNNISKLPDAYAKAEDSNNYKMLELANQLYSDLQKDLQDIKDLRNIQQATGKTMDRYGAMVGQSRNGSTDEQYRVKIMNKISSMISSSDYNSVKNNICQMLDIDSSSIQLVEGELSVAIYGLTLELIESTGLSSEQIYDMIKKVLPAGVGLARLQYKGTLLVVMYSGSTGSTQYPQLFPAWKDGQKAFADGKDIGLSGYGEVPSSFKDEYPTYKTTGTYVGGTLSSLSGE